MREPNVEMKLGKHFNENQREDFFAELEKIANGHPIVGHMFGSCINYYIDNYHPDNRIGQDTTYDGFYLWERVE